MIFSSFMRSGSTFFRKYLEAITGIATGSPFINKVMVNFSLEAMGFKGESHIADTWFLKSHFPIQFRTPHSFPVNKAIVCVRNPLDMLISHFNLYATASHNRTMANDICKEFADEWDFFVKGDMQTWLEYNEYWIRQARDNQLPVFFFRFEDLLKNPYAITRQVFQFVLGRESIEGTYLDERIKKVVGLGDSPTLYKPRSGGVNGNVHMYSREQMEYIKETCREQLHFFGYSKCAEQVNSTGFFEYQTLSDDEKSSQFEFLKYNQR